MSYTRFSHRFHNPAQPAACASAAGIIYYVEKPMHSTILLSIPAGLLLARPVNAQTIAPNNDPGPQPDVRLRDSQRAALDAWPNGRRAQTTLGAVSRLAGATLKIATTTGGSPK